jgi:2-polyprenyl-3-methyl-5-hydroxy-6-metoxy-1,4-benzoquinol methylase
LALDDWQAEPAGDSSYLFDPSLAIERERLDAQSALWDAYTVAKLAGVGVGEGWHCLEVGAGTGSVARWLCARVGDRGGVTATDVETCWLEALAETEPNLDVRRHDVVADELEEGTYDLVHARLVLMHLVPRDLVVGKLARALRPGGWLVLEDLDTCTLGYCDPPDPVWTKVSRAIAALAEAVGADPNVGRRLPTALQAAGLTDVAADGAALLARPTDLAPALLPLFQQLGDRLVDAGLVTGDELAHATGELGNERSTTSTFTPLLVTARGRRPPAPLS